MRLREMIISNYRCIGSEGLRIVIDNIVVLIGSNNVGKTTVLKAYESFTNASTVMKLEDFHKNSTENPIEITGVFSNISEQDIQQIGSKWIFEHSEYGACIKYKWIWNNANEKGNKFSWDNESNEWCPGGMGGWDSKIASCIPTPLKINPLDSPDELEKKIIEILTEAIKDKSELDNSKIKNLINQLNDIANEVKVEIEDTLNTTTNKVEERMSTIFPECKINIIPQVGKFEPEKIIASGSFINVSDKSGSEYPLSSQGAGLQRTFLWSAIESLADSGNLKIGRNFVKSDKPRILLIEEPEAFLHPPSIRAAREALYKIADLANWQLMITTHSPIFIDVSKDHTTIIRVDKNENCETRIFSTDKAGFEEEDRKRLQMIRACNPSVNEFFFSDKIVLVEGDTEETILNKIKDEKKTYSNISIVNCYGKANIPMFQKILNHFGVNYIVIHDVDSPKSKRKDKWVKNSMWSINYKIFEESKICEGSENIIIANMPDFEFQYFLELQKGDKPFNAICKLSDADFINTPQYKELYNFFELVTNNSHPRSINSVQNYEDLLNNYIENIKPYPIEKWELDLNIVNA
ncbi:AAA family ATPase [Paeniclostridium sordellii]|uniref:ATP-dependent nuclease n=1 Tax=Paraclostridium sordellii TaxID=1505 RepID=UPI0012B09609|nr:AAA family ATPase [Paeniclostridium sordellii]MRZ28084.1 AAA family ATPase [Paeniclostridium sordellii]